MNEKRSKIGGKATKLRGGLEKLEETGVQVTEMSKIAEEKQVVVAKAKIDCEELLVTIVQDKRVADEQEKHVTAEAQKIEKEAEEANAIAAECQAGLDKAMPALAAAEAALNVLTKKDMAELKAYAKPPALVELCLKGVMTVLKKSPAWDAAKKCGFIKRAGAAVCRIQESLNPRETYVLLVDFPRAGTTHSVPTVGPAYVWLCLITHDVVARISAYCAYRRVCFPNGGQTLRRVDHDSGADNGGGYVDNEKDDDDDDCDGDGNGDDGGGGGRKGSGSGSGASDDDGGDGCDGGAAHVAVCCVFVVESWS